jgi:hypothetical protein
MDRVSSMPGIKPISEEEYMRRYREWLPKFKAILAENRRQMKIYCAMAKLKKLRDRSAVSADAGK